MLRKSLLNSTSSYSLMSVVVDEYSNSLLPSIDFILIPQNTDIPENVLFIIGATLPT